jgi:Photosynthetic reaction centre cytochrome C subunit
MTYKKAKITFSIIAIVVVAQAFTIITQPQWKNLKVLPQNITHDSLDALMDDYKYSLGVRCNYCHAPAKDNPRRMDMASDANAKKEITRTMIKMTNEINQKYVANISHADTTKLQVVTCYTCHRGKPKPDVKF